MTDLARRRLRGTGFEVSSIGIGTGPSARYRS